MLNNYKLEDKKLSENEFSDKYWKGGIEEYVYQFHTMHIEDGLDERQQLLINNDQAIWKLINNLIQKQSAFRYVNDREKRIEKAEKAIKRLEVLWLLGFLIIMVLQLISVFP